MSFAPSPVITISMGGTRINHQKLGWFMTLRHTHIILQGDGKYGVCCPCRWTVWRPSRISWKRDWWRNGGSTLDYLATCKVQIHCFKIRFRYNNSDIYMVSNVRKPELRRSSWGDSGKHGAFDAISSMKFQFQDVPRCSKVPKKMMKEVEFLPCMTCGGCWSQSKIGFQTMIFCVGVLVFVYFSLE